MEYRNLGRSGLKVSAFSFGAWVTFGDPARQAANEACLRAAYEAGVNFFDNAEGYANGAAEEVMGEILRKAGWRRDTYLVSSKVFFGTDRRLPNQRGLGRKHLVEACHAAQRRLQVEYLDLYFCHRYDPEVPVEEIVRTMNHLVARGDILYWGTSEWPAVRLWEAVRVADRLGLEGPVMEQPQYNLLCRQRVEVEYRPLFEQCGLGSTIWSPLASGLLTGKYNDGLPAGSRLSQPGLEWLRDGALGAGWETRRARIQGLLDLAREAGLEPAPLALAWCLLNPHVSTVILGASRAEQLTANLRALDLVPRLDEALRRRLDQIFPVSPAA